VGLPAGIVPRIAEAVTKGLKPTVIWLHFQECTGCTESLLRTSHPSVASLILDLVSLDYHETLFAAAGHQAEAALRESIAKNKGKYVCVIEGAIPTKDNGVYCKIGGRTAMEIAHEVAKDAVAVVTTGSCASWGGVPSAAPNPTGASGAPDVLKDLVAAGKPLVTIPGCPANPYILLGTLLQFVTLGTLPELDDKKRPKWAYSRTIHEHCPRRSHFDAGRFVLEFGDDAHRAGHCLYQMGCKGPVTHANCSVYHFGELPDAWPIGIGHPCFGCAEKGVGFTIPLHDTVEAEMPTMVPAGGTQKVPGQEAAAPASRISPVVTGVAGVAAGVVATYALTRRKGNSQPSSPDGEGKV
jgi:hydrogenase small subunit